jgi:ABC-type glycerol-3-phosphate transport system substrate-binding protein
VAYPTDRWTWDDWFRAAEKTTTGQGDTKVFGYQAQENWVRNSYWVKQAGKESWDRIVGPSRSLFDDPVVLDALQRQIDMRLRYRYAPMPADGATIYNGRAAMMVEGDWTMWTYRQDQRVRWGVAPLPGNKRKATVLLVHGSSMAARSKAPEATWEWMKYYTGEEAQQLHVQATGRVAITPDLARKIFLPYAKSEFGCENPEVFLTRWEYGSHWGISDIMADMERDVLTPAFLAVFRGEQPAATALPEAAKKVNEMLKSSRMATTR